MGIDPMADEAGQQGLSPYHAMACNPSTMVDPLGLVPHGEAHGGGGVPMYGNEMAMRFPTIMNFMVRFINFADRTADQSMAEYEIRAAAFHQKQNEEATTGGGNAQQVNNLSNVDPPQGVLLPEVEYIVSNIKSNNIFKKAWSWIKSLNFHFDIGAEVTFGAQIGTTGDIQLGTKKLKTGAEVNVGSVEVVSGSAEADFNKDDATGKVEGNYYNKDGRVKWTQGAGGGIGVAGGSVEREFYSGPRPENKTTFEGSAGPFSAEYSPNNPDNMDYILMLKLVQDA